MKLFFALSTCELPLVWLSSTEGTGVSWSCKSLMLVWGAASDMTRSRSADAFVYAGAESRLFGGCCG